MKLKTKFQDEDFELGEVVDANIFYSGNSREGFKVVAAAKAGGLSSFYYNSIKDFTDHWEDAPEEPKEYWYIRDDGSGVGYSPIGNSTVAKRREEIGNYFGAEEEAGKAVEKLKAWKRLKDKGFRFRSWKEAPLRSHSSCIAITANMNCDAEAREDLDLLFGGEE